MTPFFSNPIRVSHLDAVAESWVGTPWRAHSRVRGVGASCHFAVAGVLSGAGYDTSAVPDGAPGWSRDQRLSLMERWLDGLPEKFHRIEVGQEQPGDILGFRVGQCIHHIGLKLDGGRFFQCIAPNGALILPCAELLYRERLARVWRPMA